jgi:hypothetical protein
MSDITVRVLWGFHEDPKEYSFNTQAEADAFLLGVDESNGWLCYEVEEDCGNAS